MARGGFSLVEAVVATAVLGVILAAIVPSFVSYLRLNTESKIRSGAINAAQGVLERLRGQDFASWPASGTVETAVVGERAFSVAIAQATYCQAGACMAGARRVRLEVSYRERRFFEVETVYTAFD